MSAEPERYVLDSYALLAYLQGEPGMERVKAVLHAAEDDRCRVYCSWINLGEVLYITERGQGVWRARETLALVQALPIQMLEADSQAVLQAAHIKASHPLAYADAFAVAAALQEEAVILTGDPEFCAVEGLAPVEWLRE
jgi:predicted nucleic acid-binding protein